MTISMYQASVPVFTRMLTNTAAILDAAAAYAQARRIEPAVLIGARLYPDMFPLSRQVQIATDHAKGCSARLAGQEPPRYEDTEATFPELIQRVRKTVTFLGTLTPEQIDGSEDGTIQLPMRGETLTLKGLPYLLNMALPNFYFHVTTAYCILRHNGISIGKQDYIGGR